MYVPNEIIDIIIFVTIGGLLLYSIELKQTVQREHRWKEHYQQEYNTYFEENIQLHRKINQMKQDYETPPETHNNMIYRVNDQLSLKEVVDAFQDVHFEESSNRFHLISDGKCYEVTRTDPPAPLLIDGCYVVQQLHHCGTIQEE